MKKIIIVCLLVLVLSVGIVQAASQDTLAVSVSLINQNPDPAITANTVEVRFGVENRGGIDAQNFVVELLPQYPFSAVPGETYTDTIATLKAYQQGSDMEIVKFKVAVDKNAVAGEYPLKIRTYPSGQTSSATYSVNISVGSSASAESISIDKTQLIPGKEDTVTFTILNTGYAPLNDLTFTWENPDGVILPVGSDNRNYVKYIGVGESVKLPYKLMANSGAAAGLYELALTLTYYDSLGNQQRTITSSAGMYVGGGTDFDVAFSDSSSGTTAFTIANIGSNPATSVSVIIPEQPVWSASGSNSAIIGNLNKGDYTVVSFTLQQSALNQSRTSVPLSPSGRNSATQFNRSQTGGLIVRIQYTDTSGTRQTVEKEISMSQNSARSSSTTVVTPQNFQGFGRAPQQSFFSKYKYYLFVFVILLAGVIFGLYRSRYNKEKLVNPTFNIRDLFRKKRVLIVKRK